MRNWAILSGIEGNITAYEAVQSDIKRQQKYLEAVYILGDFIGATPESEKVVQRLRHPKPRELFPQVCLGWWEEQAKTLYGLGVTSEPTQLIEKYGADTVKLLWNSVSRQTVEWLRGLDFGFFELDCLLIHGTTLSVDEQLKPETPPLQILDRLMRVGANNLFCGRSGKTFEYQLLGGSMSATVMTLDTQTTTQMTTSPRRVVGVGNVGRQTGVATYTLYDPDTNLVEFRTVHYGAGKGFQKS